MDKIDSGRRRFLKQVSAASLAVSQLSPLLLMRQALAAGDYSSLSDYKALVCVFLHGGNDAFNMFVPMSGARSSSYQSLRGSLAVPGGSLRPLNGTGHGFHPNMPNLQGHFNQGKLALVSNVGNLIEPLSKQRYFDWENGDASVRVPPTLFSHSDQSYFWQTSYPPNSSTGVDSGWGGRMADLLAASNHNPYVPITITLDGHSPWQASPFTSQLALNYWNGIEGFEQLEKNEGNWPPWRNSRVATWEKLLQLHANSGHALQEQIVHNIQRTRDRVTEVKAALARTQTCDQNGDCKDIFTTPYNAENELAAQLRMVARMIDNRDDFGQKRQIFVVSLGGWDTHGSQAQQHPGLLEALDEALGSFYQVLGEMGVQDAVTTFTASEFGRTMGTNGDGTDHGWGTHLLVLGDAVKGGQVYGELPLLERDSADDIGDAILPKIATDQYGATLARWLGITDADLDLIFPYLGNFSSRNLGFMS